ncbi:ribosome small subunit-dependent GTPase A [Paucibacter sp. APW11]|uniref:Small ribosomal subunit biogenesis GTPase RsgA n=1 Tax=Roseateles aquae TaxID=3077235 RepID=A0ABU3PE75_9BURK|nr:ribosome small subunit-dependent GTPase A [Paucibacter sp. APW11]MDT9000427.1 ribosome small subunit-dependent GTPase A [Paucibacter sp. APW11]
MLFQDQDFPALQSLGFSEALLPALQAAPWHDGARLARLCALHRDQLQLHDTEGTLPARVRPELQRQLAAADQSLAVGDWLLFEVDASGQAWAYAQLPPLNRLCRRNPEGFRQPLVSNVDLALLVMGLDHDFNLARLDRYLVLCHSQALPCLIVLSKADLCADLPARLAPLYGHLAHSHALDVLALNGTAAADSAAALAPWLRPGQTLVLLGSSGAGKSTLANALTQSVSQQTGTVRADDSRGRHTTTARQLLHCPNGACIIDTPGLRALQLDADARQVDAAFDDVQHLSQSCRFRNCRHQGEPGCAVREALPEGRLRSYQKLQREVAREQMGPLERREAVSVWKQRSREARHKLKLKHGD